MDVSIKIYCLHLTFLYGDYTISSLIIFFLWFIVVAVNYVAISEALGVSPSVLAAGVAADNVISAIYFIVLFAIASKIPPEDSTRTSGMCSIAIFQFAFNLCSSVF